MLILLALLILGIVWVASALIDNDAASMESLYGMECKRTFTRFHCKYSNAGFQLHVFSSTCYVSIAQVVKKVSIQSAPF